MKYYYDPNSPNGESKTDPNYENQEASTVPPGTIRETTKSQHEKMKGQPFKVKLKYFFGYYKFHLLAFVIVTGILVSIIVSIATHKDYGFYSMMINSVNINAEAIQESFGHYAGIDLDKYECYIDPNAALSQNANSNAVLGTDAKFAASISTRDLDCIIANSDTFFQKANNEVLADLTTVLSPEDIERFEDQFYYIDASVFDIEDYELPQPDSFGTAEEQWDRLKKQMDPSGMKKPVAVGIVCDDCALNIKTDCYFSSIPVFGIIVNSERFDTAVSFLHYIYDENIDFSQITSIY